MSSPRQAPAIDPHARTLDSGPGGGTAPGAATTPGTPSLPSSIPGSASAPASGPGPGESDPHADTIAGSAPPLAPPGPSTGPRPAATPSGDLAGRQLAHFRVEKRLGRGGMGEVYLATDLALDRPVALKLISPAVAADPGLRQRFLREARAQARLQHPNVCHIYYVGEQDGRLFFAMEYVEGESLQERLDREGKLPPGEAVELCRQAALGLREAHRHGFTHRDVKPSNLMVDRNGVVKLVDFGLVKQAGAAGEQGRLSHDASLTRTSFLGTPLYVAPEQAKGDPVDFRADLYSLGATLHHLVAGRPPFTGETVFSIVSRHLVEPRPKLVQARPRWGPSPLDALCDRMMAKRPEDRFASYDDLLAAMERLSPAANRPAGFWPRAFASMLDMVIVFLLWLPISLVARGEIPKLVGFTLVGLAYYVVGHGRWGRTLGKTALDLETVSADRAGPPGYASAAKRWAAFMGLTSADLLLLKVVDHFDDGWSTGLQVLVGAPLVIFAAVVPVAGAVLLVLRPDRRAPWDVVAGTIVRYRGKSSPG